MPNYIRNKIPGTSYFFTLVTYQRRMIFNSKEARDILRKAIQLAKAKNGDFAIDAICLLPDHIHCIWTLQENDFDYSTKWKTIKSYFSHNYLKVGGSRGIVSASKQKKGELGIWQRRFWEHTLINEKDYQTHFDYIHFNPVKHSLVTKVQDWPWSSFHHYTKIGVYDPGWGDMDFDNEIDFGE